MTSAIMQKLQKETSLKYSSILSESEMFDQTYTTTNVPIINAAFSGTLTGGFGSGLSVIAGASKHFKTNIGLVCVEAYLRQNPDAICLFYDSEFGTPPDYLASFDIDTSRILHLPIAHIEELKFDISKKLEAIDRKEKVIIFIDSVGNLASKKEVDDAASGNSAADMSRAKAMKSLFRIVTPQLIKKDIPCITINHTYKEIGLFPKDIVSGGTGIYYSANTIFIVGRRQNKDGKEVTGYDFILNAEKSRFVKEKSKFPFSVSWENGIDRWGGLLEIALELGYVEKPKVGWYTRILADKKGEVKEDKKWRKAETSCAEFWAPILKETDFATEVGEVYKLGGSKMFELPATVDLADEGE